MFITWHSEKLSCGTVGLANSVTSAQVNGVSVEGPIWLMEYKSKEYKFMDQLGPKE